MALHAAADAERLPQDPHRAMPTLEDCDDLFLRYFDRWYSDDDRQRRGFEATKPDMFTAESLVGLDGPHVSPLTDEARDEVIKCIAAMVDAARGDWPEYLGVSGDMDLDWVQAFDEYYGRERVAEVVARSDPEDFGCDYVVLCCQFGAVLGHVMRAMQPRLVWYLDWPYWESMLLDPKTGTVIPVFHWAIKKMSDYGVDDGFVSKIRRCLEILEEEE